MNVVRAGSSVSEPSAKILDTGEVLKTRTLTGADVVREKIDIPDRVEPDTQLVLIPFAPVKKGQSVRLRISETYTDPARYALVDGQLMWHRSFGRPRNDMVLPAGLVSDDQLDSGGHHAGTGRPHPALVLEPAARQRRRVREGARRR